MTANLRDTSPLSNRVRQIYFISYGIFCFHFLACPADWATNGVYCYYIDATRTVHRHVARQKCQSMGADLAKIKSPGERNFIFELMKKTPGLGAAGVWLGLDRSGSSWRWIDGTPASYLIWADGEPNNSGGNENCGQMYRAPLYKAGKWNDTPCSYDRAPPSILCQKRVI